MNERWEKIERLYHAARELDRDQQAHFLDEACRSDAETRRQIDVLLKQDPQQSSFLNIPAVEEFGVRRTPSYPLPPGTRIGPYEVLVGIGKGGMGEVYKARDTKLKRDVAIKILPEEFSRDPGRIARFQREAEALAALNHPNIAAIYDLQESEGTRFLVLELIEGESLSERLQKGPLPIDQVLRYGAQIADALAAVHVKGIVHRDLKPANIMMTKTGLKVLDFGLARTPNDATLTQSNVIMGTVAYMAPEQREGKEAGPRSDIYSLGLILCEMGTGTHTQEMNGFDPLFTHVVRRCLEHDPGERWQAASDIRKELEWIASRPVVAPVTRRSSRLPWIIAALACTGLLVAAIALFRREPPLDLGPSEFTISFEKEILDLNGVPVPSPDGHYFVIHGRDPAGGSSLWIRSLDSIDARRLAGTEGAEGEAIWSPDGNWIAFYASGKLKKISLSATTAQTIADLPGFQDAAWGPQGDIIYRTTNRVPLSRVRDSGGSPQPLTTLNTSLTENSHRFPQFLPDGRRFLFVSRCGERANNALYIGSLDSPEVKRLMPAQSRVTYVPPRAGRPSALIYYRDGALVAQQFDLDSGKFIGEPVTVFGQINYNSASILASFSTSADGRVIVAGSAGADDSRLVWFNRDGEETGTLGPPAQYGQPRISPDGSRVAFQRPDPQTGNRDIWYTELARNITSRLTTHVANDWFPVWSPDGRRILFGSDRDGGTAMLPYLKTSMDPGSNESRLMPLDGEPFDWSRDGQWISYGAFDVNVAPASGNVPPFAFLATPAYEVDARFSPDTKWIAYSSNESGRSEVYARPFAGAPSAPTGKVQISNNGGEFPVWGPSGQEIFYMSADAAILAVDTRNLGRAETLPAPTRLFHACPTTLPATMPLTGSPYDYPFDTRDGQHFLVNCRAQPPGRFTVRMNWAFPK